MRRKLGLLLIGVGAFLIALAPLVRFYVGHKLIAAPLGIYEKTTLRADGATYLDTAHWKILNGATLAATNTTRGDKHAGDDKVAVWDSFTSVEDTSTNAKIDTQMQRAVFDRRNAELRNGRGASVNGDTSVRQTGLGLFWPINVKKKTYPYFDVTTKRTWPMNYVGEDRTQGIRTYRFVQQIPPTVTDTYKPGVPASLFGLSPSQLAQLPGYDKKYNAVAVDRVYQATTTAWVDPRTGAQVSLERNVRTTLRTPDGVDRLVIGDLDLKMTPDSQKRLVHRSSHDADKIPLARAYVPYGGGAAGIVALVIGLVMAVSGRRGPAHQGPGSDGSVTGPGGSADSDKITETPPPGERPAVG